MAECVQRRGGSLARRAASVLVLLCVMACATPGKVDVPQDRMFRLTGLLPQEQPSVRLVDQRSQEARQSRALTNGLIVADDRIQPTPAQAVTAELQRAATQHAQASKLAAVLAAHEVQLERLDITIISSDIMGGRRAPNQPPGVVAVDYLMRSLAQSTLGVTDVTVALSIRVADRSLSAVGKGEFTASPGPDAVARPFYRAVQALADQLAASSF